MRSVLCLVLVACTHRAPVEEPLHFEITPICSAGFGELPLHMGPDHPGPRDKAFAAAHGMALFHNHHGIEHGDTDPVTAAAAFLACARAYKDIADDEPLRPIAQRSAESCTRNVAYAYSRAGKMTTDGAVALHQLAIDEPRLATAVASALDVGDCAERGQANADQPRRN